jgi:hypothetical protein
MTSRRVHSSLTDRMSRSTTEMEPGLPTAPYRGRMPRLRHHCLKSAQQNCLPLSVSTYRCVARAAIDQPTIIRLPRSMITARYTQPAAIAMAVMSAHHTVSLLVTANSLFTVFGAMGSACPESVVARNRRRTRPRTSARLRIAVRRAPGSPPIRTWPPCAA